MADEIDDGPVVSPRPWALEPIEHRRVNWATDDAPGVSLDGWRLYLEENDAGVGVLFGFTGDEAALIQRAVNHHDALFAALSAALPFLRDEAGTPGVCGDCEPDQECALHAVLRDAEKARLAAATDGAESCPEAVSRA